MYAFKLLQSCFLRDKKRFVFWIWKIFLASIFFLGFFAAVKIAEYAMQPASRSRSMKQEPQRHELHFNSYRVFAFGCSLTLAAPAVVIFFFIWSWKCESLILCFHSDVTHRCNYKTFLYRLHYRHRTTVPERVVDKNKRGVVEGISRYVVGQGLGCSAGRSPCRAFKMTLKSFHTFTWSASTRNFNPVPFLRSRACTCF